MICQQSMANGKAQSPSSGGSLIAYSTCISFNKDVGEGAHNWQRCTDLLRAPNMQSQCSGAVGQILVCWNQHLTFPLGTHEAHACESCGDPLLCEQNKMHLLPSEPGGEVYFGLETSLPTSLALSLSHSLSLSPSFPLSTHEENSKTRGANHHKNQSQSRGQAGKKKHLQCSGTSLGTVRAWTWCFEPSLRQHVALILQITASAAPAGLARKLSCLKASVFQLELRKCISRTVFRETCYSKLAQNKRNSSGEAAGFKEQPRKPRHTLPSPFSNKTGSTPPHHLMFLTLTSSISAAAARATQK